MYFLNNEKNKKIRKKLVELEWTQETLAREIGVSPSMVSLFINGRKKSKRLTKKISDLLEIDLLLSEFEEEKKFTREKAEKPVG